MYVFNWSISQLHLTILKKWIGFIFNITHNANILYVCVDILKQPDSLYYSQISKPGGLYDKSMEFWCYFVLFLLIVMKLTENYNWYAFNIIFI